MPRKTNKTEKPPLCFCERPRGGGNLQNVPEVRAALNPKEYFAETSSSACTSWVSPQFDISIPTARKGRRQRQCLASFLDGGTQLSRKKTLSKYSSLSFESRESNRSCKSQHKKNDTEDAASNVQPVQQEKRPLEKNGKRKPLSVATSVPLNGYSATKTSRVVHTPSGCMFDPTGPADDNATCLPNDLQNPPESVRESMSGSTLHWLLTEWSMPLCSQPSQILVANTPERHYGLKVTWRRREEFMILLKQRGHLSDSDVQHFN